MPRPKTKIDLAELEKLCGMQCTVEEIAAFFDVSTRTIERRRNLSKFHEAMERGKAKGRVSVRPFPVGSRRQHRSRHLPGEESPGLQRHRKQ